MAAVAFGAQFVSPAAGGIARASRLSLLALASMGRVHALGVEERDTVRVGPVAVRGCRSSRAAFVVRHNVDLARASHAFYDFAGTARARLLPRRYALWLHGNELWNEARVRANYLRVLHGAELILVNSHFTGAACARAIGSRERVRVCWLGTEEDRPPEPATSCGPPAALFVGRSDGYFAKGQDILVRLWPRVVEAVPDARLRFVGGGEAHGRLRDLVTASPAAGRIDVLGPLGEAALAREFARARMLCLLSTLEGFGLVAVEAMRHGVPVVAARGDAVEEISLDGCTGYTLDRGRDEDILDAIVGLLRDPGRAAAMGAAARDRWHAHFRLSAFEARFRREVGSFLRV